MKFALSLLALLTGTFAQNTSVGIYNPSNNYAVNQANQQNFFSSSNFYGQPGSFQQPSYSYVNSFWQPYTTAYNTGYNTGYNANTVQPMANGAMYPGYNAGYNAAYNPGYNSYGYNTGYAGMPLTSATTPSTVGLGAYATPGTYNTGSVVYNNGAPTPPPGAYVVPGSTSPPNYTPNGYYATTTTANTGYYYGAQPTTGAYNSALQYTGYTGYNNAIAYNAISANTASGGYQGVYNTGYNPNPNVGTITYNTGYNTGMTNTNTNRNNNAHTCYNAMTNSYGPCPTYGAPVGGGNYNNSPPNTLFTFNEAKSSSFSPASFQNTMSGLYAGGATWVPSFTRP